MLLFSLFDLQEEHGHSYFTCKDGHGVNLPLQCDDRFGFLTSTEEDKEHTVSHRPTSSLSLIKKGNMNIFRGGYTFGVFPQSKIIPQ